MEEGDTNELSPIQEIQQEAQNEVVETLIEGLLPKLKVFIPKAIKSVDEDDSLIVDKDSVVIIGRSEEDGSVVVMTGKKEDINIEANEGSLDVNDLSGLFETALKMLAQAKS